MDTTRRGFLKFLGKAAVVGAVIAAKPELALSKVVKPPSPEALVTNGKFSTDIKDWADDPRSFYARSGAEALGKRTDEEVYKRLKRSMEKNNVFHRKNYSRSELNEIFVRQFSENIINMMNQKGSILLTKVIKRASFPALNV